MNSKSSPQFGFKQFRTEGCISYLIFDPSTRKGALVDPSIELMEDYRSYLEDHQIRLVYALDTHTHADHLSGTHLFRSEFGAEIGMSGKTSSQRVTRRLKGGDKISVDSIDLQVIETPGHTPDSVCLYGAGIVFTGDTLFIGSSGRTDFPGSDPGQQYDSIHAIFKSWPGQTVVFPAHDYNDMICSTLETEKKKNAHGLIPSREAFIAMKKAELVPSDSNVQKHIEFNLTAQPDRASPPPSGSAMACGVIMSESNTIETINPQDYQQTLEEKEKTTAFLDVREPSEFAMGHIPHTENIPLSEIGFHLDRLKSFDKIYLSCQSGRRSLRAAKTLAYMGITNVVNVTGGFLAWSHSDFPIERSPKTRR